MGVPTRPRSAREVMDSASGHRDGGRPVVVDEEDGVGTWGSQPWKKGYAPV